MKKIKYLVSISILIIQVLFSCITEYEASGIDAIENVLVVDCIITNHETVVVLSKTISLTDDFTGKEYVEDAQVYVECEDDMKSPDGEYLSEGKYKIKNGYLDSNKKYRLFILWNNEEYVSEYLQPIVTPEIDNVELTKNGLGENVYTTVSTHDSEDKTRYYVWKYQEYWEVKAELFANVDSKIENGEEVLVYYDPLSSNNKYYCWGKDSSKVLLLGNADKYIQNEIPQQRLITMSPNNDKLSVLYYVCVYQNQIRQEAYEYFSNLQKNIENTAGLFSPMPSEIEGNIICTTQPDKKVIGYVEVSTTTVKNKFFTSLGQFYEPETSICGAIASREHIPGYILYYYADNVPSEYAPENCVDCRLKEKATKNRPSFWPNEHY